MGTQQQNSNTRRSLFAMGTPPTSDPRNDALWAHAAPRGPTVVRGIVARSGGGTYDCTVTVFNGFDIVCNVLVPVGSNTFGYTSSALPLEGQQVLVMLPALNARFGYILGVIPNADTNVKPNVGTRDHPLHGKRLQPDGKVGLEKTAAYNTPMRERQCGYFININAQRYVDVLPGEYVLSNENDCGLALAMFSSSLTAGMAYVKASRLDSSIRIVSRDFQQYSTSGYTHVFNDSGYITEEGRFSIYQGERLGISTLKGEAFEKNPDKEKDGEYYLQNKEPRQTAKTRLKSFTGFLGGLVSKFVLKPDSDIETLSQDASPLDFGLAQMNVDGAGTVKLRSAGGVYLERYDRIPVPFRKREPWDPEGDKDVSYTPIAPFEWDKDSRLRGLQLADSIAWEYGQAYRRFDDHIKDFYTPEESALKIPESKWDDIDKSESADLAKNDLKRCGVYMGADGSVIIRDNWGSEIVMAGGDVTITARNDIKVATPKSVAILGKNVALDASSGIDVAAKDVLVAADKNLHALANGILLESKGKEYAWADHQKGADTQSTGITLKGPATGVVVDAQTVHVAAQTSMDVITGARENDRNGMLRVSAGEAVVRGNQVSVLTPNGVVQLGYGCTFYGEAVNMYTTGGISAYQDKNMYIFQSVTTKNSPVSRVKKQMDDEEKKWRRYATFTPYTRHELMMREFSFRSSKQAETDKSLFVQPAWITDWSKETQDNKANVKKWEPLKVEGVGSEYSMAWPGYDVFTGGQGYKYAKVRNMSDGKAKDRKALESSTEIKEGSLEEYPRGV